MYAHAYHHSPEAIPPLVQTWARAGGEIVPGPLGQGACYVLTDAEIERSMGLSAMTYLIDEAAFAPAADGSL